MFTNVSQDPDSRKPHLAAILHSGNCNVDKLLRNIARQLKQDGYRVGGVIKAQGRRPGAHRCDMSLEELTTGRFVYISQQLGPGSTGCRLDAAALEYVVGMVDTSLDTADLDILIVNKFGKREADGRGFNSTIAKAVVADIPVLVTLNQDHSATWQKFCGDEGQTLPNDRGVVMKWLAERLPHVHEKNDALKAVHS